MQADLTIRADDAAHRTHQTRQKVWHRLKKQLNIRQLDQIQQGNLEQAKRILQEMR